MLSQRKRDLGLMERMFAVLDTPLQTLHGRMCDSSTAGVVSSTEAIATRLSTVTGRAHRSISARAARLVMKIVGVAALAFLGGLAKAPGADVWSWLML
ncbi:hypothetical protein [Streptomyces sp. NPDC004267]|uniref:hypothetical protein n=1 Tax=Streptomyces sp. NPDC004267 TaxID=3364694 RepID=UPI0036C66F67